MNVNAHRFTRIIPGLLALILFLSAPALGSDKEKYKVALLPLVFHADPSKAYLRSGFKSMFLSRLSGEGIELIQDGALLQLLTKEEKTGIASRDRAEGLAEALNADFVIFGSVTAMGSAYSFDLTIIDLEKGKATQVTETTTESELISKIADVVYQFRAAVDGIDLRAIRMAQRGSGPEERATKGLFFRPDTEEGTGIEPAGRISLRTSVMAMNMADLDGDGASEMIILDRKKVLVYQGKDQTFARRGTLEASLGEEFLKVSVGDADGDGIQEIYLVGRYGSQARTTVWIWNGKFKRLLAKTGHLRAVTDLGNKRPLLLFQDSKMDDFFRGKIYQMAYEGKGKLARKAPLKGLEKAQIYTLTLFDLNRDGRSEFLGLNDFSRLHVWDRDGTVLWRGDRKLGGTNNSIRHKLGQTGDLEPLVELNSGFLITDIDKDGAREVLAINNIPMVGNLEHFKVYERSNLVVYKIKGDALAPSLTSMKMRYCLTDMQADGEVIYLAAQKAKMTNIGEGASRIMWFK